MTRLIATAVLALAAATAAAADRLVLTDTSVLEGEYLGGNRSTLHFRVDGETRHLPLERVDTLALDPVRQPLAAAAPPAPPTAHAVIVPTGDGLHAVEIRRLPDEALPAVD